MSLPSPSEIYVRAYTEKPGARPLAAKSYSGGDELVSPWSLTFDCETTTDPAQSLRVGVYQVRKSEKLKEEGLFYDPNILDGSDIGAVETYAQEKGLKLLSIDEFRKDVFLKIGYLRQGRIIGFNLPFDISRIALSHGEARRSMRGGFSFHMSLILPH